MRNGIALLVICTLLLGACATAPATPAAPPTNIKEWMELQSRARRKALAGALIGAALGAATASLTGADSDDIWKQALAGGIAGALAGFAIGKREDKLFEHRDLAVRRAEYDNTQGYIARVEEVMFQPIQPKPGETATLYVRYLVLGPDPNEPIRVKMFRGLKYGDQYILGAGPNEFVIPRGGGVVESRMQVTLPEKAPQGTYSVEALLEDTKGRFPQVIGIGALIIARGPGAGAGVRTAAR